MDAIRYADFNNNIYSIEGQRMDYQPVQAKNSSTGFYDGGDSRKASLSSEQGEHIKNLISRILAEPELLSVRRQMLTALLRIREEEKWRSYILKKSGLQNELQTYLENVLG